MSREIEIKLGFDSKNAVLSAMKNAHAKYLGTQTLVDCYFGQDNDDMNNHEHGLLRVRQDGNSAELTYKGKIMGKAGVWERVELNTPIHDPATMEQILSALGFRKVSENESTRELWSLGACTLIFVTFRKPVFMELLEVEGPTKSDVDDVVALLGDTVKKFDIAAFDAFDKARKPV